MSGAETSKDEIFKKLVEVLVEGFDVRRQQLVPEARLVEDLDLDSLDRIDLFVRLEQEVDLEIAEEELRAMHTVQDIVDVIHRKLNAAPA